MNLSITGINNYRSKVSDELGAAEFMNALSSVHLATKKNINEAVTRLNAALYFWISRCNGEFDSKWILKVNSMIENARLAVMSKGKQGIRARKDLFKHFIKICFYADNAVRFLVCSDEDNFSKTMTFFSSRAFYNKNGIEKVVAMDDKFQIVDREIDPDCSGTTMILNILTRNRVSELDEMDIMGWANELQYYTDDKEPEEIANEVKDDDNSTSAIIIKVPSGGYVVDTMREIEAMEDPYFSSKDALYGTITLLSDFFGTEKGKQEDSSFLDNLKEFWMYLDGKHMGDSKIAEEYLANCSKYADDLTAAYDILSKYNLPRVVMAWPIDEYYNEVKLVVGLLMTGENETFFRLIKPETRDDMYIECSDYDAYTSLVEGIGRSYERTKTAISKAMGNKNKA